GGLLAVAARPPRWGWFAFRERLYLAEPAAARDRAAVLRPPAAARAREGPRPVGPRLQGRDEADEGRKQDRERGRAAERRARRDASDASAVGRLVVRQQQHDEVVAGDRFPLRRGSPGRARPAEGSEDDARGAPARASSPALLLRPGPRGRHDR